LPNDSHLFVSTERANRRDVTFAVGAALLSGLIFIAIVPFAGIHLAAMPAFIPSYESTLILSDLITAVLLFGQFDILRSRALYVLACGYLFSAATAIVHELTFPGVFSATGLLGARLQSTVWLYVFWHTGFPISVLLYALLKSDRPESAGARPGPAIIRGIAVVLAFTGALALIAVKFGNDLPVLVVGDRFTPAFNAGMLSLSILCIVVIFALLRRRPLVALDLWLMVVMCAWVSDLTLCGVFNTGRFDLGWYGGRVYGLLAANSLLFVLLSESATHYARLAQLSTQLSAANAVLEQVSRHDGLTGLANRRTFDSHLATQIAIAKRQGWTLALILFDVDEFKSYNDNHGHQAGDECLRQVASALRSCCRRPTDLAARYGGEEFALILPDTELIGAVRIAEAARKAVAQLGICHAQSQTVARVTISGGIAMLFLTIDTTAEDLIAVADKNLYEAKRRGRDRMIWDDAALLYKKA
jgi:diguanylate cyclase (GGDEF)-like protein